MENALWNLLSIAIGGAVVAFVTWRMNQRLARDSEGDRLSVRLFDERLAAYREIVDLIVPLQRSIHELSLARSYGRPDDFSNINRDYVALALRFRRNLLVLSDDASSALEEFFWALAIAFEDPMPSTAMGDMAKSAAAFTLAMRKLLKIPELSTRFDLLLPSLPDVQKPPTEQDSHSAAKVDRR